MEGYDGWKGLGRGDEVYGWSWSGWPSQLGIGHLISLGMKPRLSFVGRLDTVWWGGDRPCAGRCPKATFRRGYFRICDRERQSCGLGQSVVLTSATVRNNPTHYLTLYRRSLQPAGSAHPSSVKVVCCVRLCVVCDVKVKVKHCDPRVLGDCGGSGGEGRMAVSDASRSGRT